MRRVVLRELYSLVGVLAVMLAIQFAFDALAPVWALVIFVMGWIALRAIEIRRRHGKDAPPSM